MRCDLVIVGGGPAGLATAIHAAQRGREAIVFDRRELPLDKACGEGVMPSGVAALERMGVEIPASARAAFAGIRYIDEARVAEGRFRNGVGWGVRRTALIEALVARARMLGVELRYGSAVERWRCTPDGVVVESEDGPLHAALLVGADGLRSQVRRRAGLERRWRGRQRVGLRCHFVMVPWSTQVEVYWSDGAEAYVTPLGADRINVAILWAGERATFSDLLRRFPRLSERLRGARAEGVVRGAGPFRQAVRRRYADRVALVGDAAGYVDAITGEGVSLGFRCAEALVDTVVHGRPLADYEARYVQLSRAYYRVTGLLLLVARWPRLRRRVLRVLAHDPDLFTHLLAISNGDEPCRARSFAPVLRRLALAAP